MYGLKVVGIVCMYVRKHCFCNDGGGCEAVVRQEIKRKLGGRGWGGGKERKREKERERERLRQEWNLASV